MVSQLEHLGKSNQRRTLQKPECVYIRSMTSHTELEEAVGRGDIFNGASSSIGFQEEHNVGRSSKQSEA